MLHVETGRRPGERDGRGALRDKSLLAVAVAHDEAPRGEAGPDLLQEVLVVLERAPQGLCDRLACQVILGRSQAAGKHQ